MSLFTCVVEGRLVSTPTTDTTRDGRPYVQFPLIHRARYRDASGKWVDAKPMEFDVVCWGALADRARNLVRGDQVVVEASRIMAFYDDSDQPALKLSAVNLSVSMRFADAHAGTKPPARRGDIVVTPDGERYAADAFPDATTDRELVHN